MTDAERILQAGQSAFPQLAVPREAMLVLVRERLEGEPAPASLDADEIYLASACALADPAAIAAFERRYFPVIGAALSRLDLARHEIADIEQQLRIRLFVSGDEGGARIVAYAGQGELGGLIRVAALRAGLNAIRDRGRAVASGDELEDIPITRDDPALVHLKARHRAAFKTAFQTAIATLEPRERSLLNLALVRGLGIDKVATIYGIHRATAARWIARAREQLTRAVHHVARTELGVGQDELPDLLHLVESQLELSLERLLKTQPA